MKRYEKYKPTGIQWLPEIPEYWEYDRLKKLFILHRGYDLSKEQKNTEFARNYLDNETFRNFVNSRVFQQASTMVWMANIKE